MTRNINDAFEAMQELLEDGPPEAHPYPPPDESDYWSDLEEWAWDHRYREDADTRETLDRLPPDERPIALPPHCLGIYDLEAA